ncbi:MAG: glycosyltransferase family 2 protein, partial [Candidatus Shapirobacteria bacterium]|nr:glycosyltransferase family 2 protein [Candidatus Shapirobacteria bacterium]
MNPKPMPELSVFFPCYNEEKNIANTFNKALPIIKEIAHKWEVILINDGSKDNTAEILDKIVKKYPKNVKIVTHNPNRGYGAAFKSGLYAAKYPWIAFTNADGQFDFNDIKTLISTQNNTKADMVIGYYLGRKVSFVRILGSKIWQILVFILFGLWVVDTDCGFKLINKRIPDIIPKLVAERGPFINSEFLIQ